MKIHIHLFNDKDEMLIEFGRASNGADKVYEHRRVMVIGSMEHFYITTDDPDRMRGMQIDAVTLHNPVSDDILKSVVYPAMRKA